ncbi:MAG: hypothetical protein JXM69_05725 [Anaerolineae bacterium]|nr:hypothetical protein [Anaerolineae bacterium]
MEVIPRPLIVLKTFTNIQILPFWGIVYIIDLYISLLNHFLGLKRPFQR